MLPRLQARQNSTPSMKGQSNDPDRVYAAPDVWRPGVVHAHRISGGIFPDGARSFLRHCVDRTRLLSAGIFADGAAAYIRCGVQRSLARHSVFYLHGGDTGKVRPCRRDAGFDGAVAGHRARRPGLFGHPGRFHPGRNYRYGCCTGHDDGDDFTAGHDEVWL